MRWLFRLTLFIMRSVLAILAWVIANLFRLLLPWILAALRFLINLVTGSLSATVQGPGRYTQWLASEWTRQLLDLGVSRDYLDQIYGLCRLLVVVRIVAGLAVATLFTVAILRVVFGYLI